jgi:hypothetical protein
VKITDSGTDSPQYVGFLGIGLTGQQAVLSPSSLGFGVTLIGTTSPPQAVTLSNPGSAPLAISSISIYNPSFGETNNCPAMLAPGAVCTISVTFSPIPNGDASAYLFVVDDATYSPQSVFMVGQALGSPSATILPAAMNFRDQNLATTSLTQTITMTNSGTSNAFSSSVVTLTGENQADFVITQDSCFTSYLAPGASCQIQINFTPAAVGSRTASLSIENLSLGFFGNVPLSGTGIANLDFDDGKPGNMHLVADFDGDGKPDFVVWRPASGTWYVIPSSHPSAPIVQQWGLPGDIPVPGDYDGDGKTDFAVWRPSNGTWYVMPSRTPSAPIIRQWGLPGDIPVPGDFDGDGRLDWAVWRPSIGTWYIIPSSHPAASIVQQWGLPGDIPVVGDFDGDGKTDFAVWRQENGVWYVIPSSDPTRQVIQQWGLPGDVPVVGDFDGDKKTDFAVWRPSLGIWFVMPSTSPLAPIVQQWGLFGDVPIAVDFDGDQKTDFTVWRPPSGVWYIIASGSPATPGTQQWGLPGDIPM